jgi:hypothetical protein
MHSPPSAISDPFLLQALGHFKNVLINCHDLTFTLHYSHVKARQDDNVVFDKLNRKLQSNCICNHLAKQRASAIWCSYSSKTTPYSPWNPLVSLSKAQSCCLIQASRYASTRTISLQRHCSCGRRSRQVRDLTRYAGTLFMPPFT